MPITSNVVFNSGEPIDINKLNQLQSNINELFKTTSLTNTTVSDQGKQISFVPIVDCGEEEITVNGGSNLITFANKAFTATPTIVASIAQDIAKETSYTVRARPLNSTSARIEVTSSSANAVKTILVNWIAIQKREIGA